MFFFFLLCEGQIQSCKKVTSVIDKWLVAVVNTDARLLATVRLSSLVSCSTRWYLRRGHKCLCRIKTKHLALRMLKLTELHLMNMIIISS